MLGAILLLADVAQRHNVSHILRRAVLITAYQDWDTLVQLVTDMDLLETYQPPAALLDGSILIDHDIILEFIREKASLPFMKHPSKWARRTSPI